MNPVTIYLIGFVTPFVLFLLLQTPTIWDEWRKDIRYRRAWDKFTAEWDAKSPEDRAVFIRHYDLDDDKTRPQYATYRDAWFAHRWRNGYTDEV